MLCSFGAASQGTVLGFLSCKCSGTGLNVRLPLPLPAKVPVVKHLFTVRVQSPVIPFSWIIFISRHLLEAVIEGQVVPYGILPASFAFVVEREVVGHVLVDLAQRQPLVRGPVDGHGNEGRVGVRGSHQLHELLLGREGKPAKVSSPQAVHVGQELPLHPVRLRDEGAGVGSRQKRWWWGDGRSVQPEVGIGSAVVIRGLEGAWPLGAGDALRVEEVLVVDVHLGGLLADAGELGAAARRGVRGRLKEAHALPQAAEL